MSSSAQIEARVNAIESVHTSYHGIAARLDRLPRSKVHRKLLWLLAGVTFCDNIDMNIGGPIIAQLLVSGYSDATLNAAFVSITMLGYLFGGLLAGVIADGIGRKKAVIICASVFTAGCLCAAAAPNMHVLIGCRFIMGLGLGAAYPTAFSSLSEFTPPSIRGQYQSWMGLVTNMGAPVASFISLIILPMVGWRPVFLMCACLGLFVVFMNVRFVDESPRWLASKGRFQEADAIVKKYEDAIRKEGLAIPEIDAETVKAEAAKREVKQLPYSFLFKKSMITRTLTACFLCFAMNATIYTIVTWTPTIFVTRGFDISQSVTMTVVMQLGIPVGIFLLGFIVEKINRKPLLIGTFLICAVGGILWSFIPADQTGWVMFVGFLLCLVLYPNSVVIASVYLPEPFPTECRIRGTGFANAFGRLAGIFSPMWITALLYSDFGVVGIYTVFAGICIAISIWLGIFGIETRGKTLEEVTEGVFDNE